MSLNPEQEESARIGPIYRVVRIFESMSEDLVRLNQMIRITRSDRDQISAILRSRLGAEHPGKLLIVGDWGYRSSADGKGLDRIPVVFSEDLPSNPPSPPGEKV